jgi:hypothetical protein
LSLEKAAGGPDDGLAQRRAARAVEPGDVGLGPEPGPLALRERGIAARVLVDRLLAVQPASSPVSTASRNAFSTGGVRSMWV